MIHIEPNQIYTPEEVAEILQVSVFTIVRHLKNGKIPGRKMGAFWRVLGDDLLNYLRINNDLQD